MPPAVCWKRRPPRSAGRPERPILLFHRHTRCRSAPGARRGWCPAAGRCRRWRNRPTPAAVAPGLRAARHRAPARLAPVPTPAGAWLGSAGGGVPSQSRHLLRADGGVAVKKGAVSPPGRADPYKTPAQPREPCTQQLPPPLRHAHAPTTWPTGPPSRSGEHPASSKAAASLLAS
jgi:hypothetical protein